MIAIVDYADGDIDALDLQPEQAGEAEGCPTFAEAGHAWTVRDEGGRVIACLGLIVAGPSVRIGWALLALGKGAALVALTRVIRRVIAGGDWNRVEIMTRPEFGEADQWAALLGFEFECTRRGIRPDGGDLNIWVRLKGAN